MSRSDIKEHMEIIGADGVHVGTVDGVESKQDQADESRQRRRQP